MIRTLTSSIVVLLLGACEQRAGEDQTRGVDPTEEPYEQMDPDIAPSEPAHPSMARREIIEQRLSAIEQWVEARRTELGEATDQASQDMTRWLDELEGRIVSADRELEQPNSNVRQLEATIDQIERDIQSGFDPHPPSTDDQQKPLELEMDG